VGQAPRNERTHHAALRMLQKLLRLLPGAGVAVVGWALPETGRLTPEIADGIVALGILLFLGASFWNFWPQLKQLRLRSPFYRLIFDEAVREVKKPTEVGSISTKTTESPAKLAEQARRERAAERATALAEETRKRTVQNFRRLVPHFPFEQKRIILDLIKGPKNLPKSHTNVYALESKGYIKPVHLVDLEHDIYLYEMVEDYREAAIEWRDTKNRTKVRQFASTISKFQRVALSFFTITEDSELPWPENSSPEMVKLHRAFSDLRESGYLYDINTGPIRIERYSIVSEYRALISEYILDGKPIVRNYIVFRPGILPGSGASGAGAPPYSRK